MGTQAGFILLYRQITEWEWYQNPNTFRVFLHCLLMANYTDGRFEGKEVKRGQLVTSLPSLADQTKLSIQQVRTALNHLKSTGEITDKAYSKYRVITVVKYNDYQQDNRQNNSQATGNQQAINRQSTGNQQQYKKDNNVKKEQRNNHHPLVEDDEAREIRTEQNRVLDAAEDAGFKMSNNVRAALIALYAEEGLERMLEGLRSCSEHGAANLAYLRAVLKGGAKKPKVAAQDYGQRDYRSVQESIEERQRKRLEEYQRRKNSADNFTQRDYSGVNNELMQDLEKDMEDFRAGTG